MKLKLLLLSAFFSSQFSFSQETENWCGTAQKMNELQLNPAALQEFLNDELTRQDEAENGVVLPKGVIYKIPVVFHVIHNGGVENTEESQILNALDVINRDFRLQNPDTVDVDPLFKPIMGDVEIEFVMATIAPDGSCFRGYTRTLSALTFLGDDGHAQVDAIRNGNDVFQGNWPSNKYLNVFVVADAGGAGGYTNYPSNWGGTDMTNGIWILHQQFGEIGTSGPSAGRSLTHECGHWLNLPHTWGSSNTPGLASNCQLDDGISDTPLTQGVSGGCPLTQNDCGPIANVQNYMDYALYCQSMFTMGQANEMRTAIQSSVGGRNNLWTAQNLQDTGTDVTPSMCKAEFSADKHSVCAGTAITFTDESYNNANGWTWTFPGGTPGNSTDEIPVITYNLPGLYEVVLTATDGSISDTETKTSYIRVLNASIPIPIHEGFEPYTTLTNIEEWGIINIENDASFELETNASLSGNNCVKIMNFGQPSGSYDELVSEPIDLSVLDPNTDNMTLSFRYAYKRKTTDDDDWLRVYLTSDCGDAWAIRKTLHGPQLTSALQTNSFVPSSVADWTTIHMTNVTNIFFTDKFRYKFAFQAGGGNNMYIDDINIYQGSPSDDIVLGTEELGEFSRLSLFPNPADKELNVSFTVQTDNQTVITIQDVSGKKIQEHLIHAIQGSNLVSIDTQKMEAGVYFMQLKMNGSTKAVKFIVK